MVNIQNIKYNFFHFTYECFFISLVLYMKIFKVKSMLLQEKNTSFNITTRSACRLTLNTNCNVVCIEFNQVSSIHVPVHKRPILVLLVEVTLFAPKFAAVMRSKLLRQSNTGQPWKFRVTQPSKLSGASPKLSPLDGKILEDHK